MKGKGGEGRGGRNHHLMPVSLHPGSPYLLTTTRSLTSDLPPPQKCNRVALLPLRGCDLFSLCKKPCRAGISGSARHSTVSLQDRSSQCFLNHLVLLSWMLATESLSQRCKDPTCSLCHPHTLLAQGGGKPSCQVCILKLVSYQCPN